LQTYPESTPNFPASSAQSKVKIRPYLLCADEFSGPLSEFAQLGPIRSLLVQAEDDESDLIEMAQIVDHLKLSEAQQKMVEENTYVEFLNDLTGQKFIDARRRRYFLSRI
jgi:hypothetical protein